MKFGIREICDVVLKAKAAQKVGNKIFYKNEPVCYFDTLKTSSMEGAATTVYAQGGRGNARLVAWEGERTITFTMEDALISPAGFMILSGAGLVEATAAKTLKVHTTEQTNEVIVTEAGGAVSAVEVIVKEKPYLSSNEDLAYVMLLDNGEVITEPYIPQETAVGVEFNTETMLWDEVTDEADAEAWKIALKVTDDLDVFTNGCVVLVDFYTEKESEFNKLILHLISLVETIILKLQRSSEIKMV